MAGMNVTSIMNSAFMDYYSVNPYGMYGSANSGAGAFSVSAPGRQQNSYGVNTPALSSAEARSYLSDVKDIGGKLLSAANKLMQSGKSVFNQKTGVSSNDEALSVSVAKQDEANKWASAKNTKSVTIDQLAAEQKNTGASFNAQSQTGAQTGANQFTIEKGGKTYNFSVNVNATDSARTAQQKMADAINKQNAGVTASVQYDDKTRKSALVLASNDTGEKNAFTIADKAGRGNLVSKLGADNTTQQARNAEYTVDGESRVSDKNNVDLGDGLTGTLKKVTNQAVEVKPGQDKTSATNAVYDLVNNFNRLRETANDNASDKGAQSLLKRMDSMSSAYGSSLNRMGISQNKDGYLQIDTEKLQKSLENGSAERNLGGGGGFTQRVGQLAKSADNNPTQYLSRESRVSGGANLEQGNNNPYASGYYASQMTQWSNIGLLFNSGF